MIPRRFTCFVLFALAAASVAQAPADISADELAKLRNRLAQLEAENQPLQKELTGLRAMRLPLQVPPPTRGLLIDPPPDWTSREFNGATYYVVPLAPPKR